MSTNWNVVSRLKFSFKSFKISFLDICKLQAYFQTQKFWNITGGIYAKYHIQIMLLFVYTTTHKRVVIFTCRYFKLSWNTTVLNQWNCRNFSFSSIKQVITIFNKWKSRKVEQAAVVEKVNIVIYWINHYPVKNTISFRTTYPSDSDLSGG